MTDEEEQVTQAPQETPQGAEPQSSEMPETQEKVLEPKQHREHDHKNWSPNSEGEAVFEKKAQAQAFAREMRRAGKYAKVVKGKDGWVVYVYSRAPSARPGRSSGVLFKVPARTPVSGMKPIQLGGVNTLTNFKEPQLGDLDVNLGEFKLPEPRLDFDIPLQDLNLEVNLPEFKLDDSFLRAFGGVSRGPRKKVRKK